MQESGLYEIAHPEFILLEDNKALTFISPAFVFDFLLFSTVEIRMSFYRVYCRECILNSIFGEG
jgi:hypothetical protein